MIPTKLKLAKCYLSEMTQIRESCQNWVRNEYSQVRFLLIVLSFTKEICQ